MARRWLLAFSVLVSFTASTDAQTMKADTLTFGETSYFHRWSKNGQNEYTPEKDKDLSRWQDMVTIDVHDSVHDGEQLATLANSVLTNYQGHGKIIRTDSVPRTPQRPAEHLIVAVLGNPELLEAVFARVVLVDGVGVVAVYSHRIYGKGVGNPMSEWLQSKGPAIEKTLMSWSAIPSPKALKALPQSK